MKILWIAHEGNRSGANNALLDYAEGLNNLPGFQVTVILPYNGNMFDECVKRNIKSKLFHYHSVIRIPHKYQLLYWLKKRARNFVTAVQVLSFLIMYKPELTITNSIVNTSLFACVSSFLGIKHIWFIQEFGDKDHGIRFDFSYQYTLSYIHRLSSKVIVVSDAVKRHLSGVIPESKIVTIFNRINIDEEYIGKGLLKNNRPFVVEHISQISTGKNQLEGLQALELLIQKGYDIKLAITGSVLDDKYKKILDAFISEHSLEEFVSFTGFSSEPLNRIANASVVILCSRSEACALVIFETLRVGTPIIVSNTGGNTEIIQDGVTGLIYEFGNPLCLAKKISELYHSEELIKRLSISALEYANANYLMEKSIAQLLVVIKEG